MLYPEDGIVDCGFSGAALDLLIQVETKKIYINLYSDGTYELYDEKYIAEEKAKLGMNHAYQIALEAEVEV